MTKIRLFDVFRQCKNNGLATQARTVFKLIPFVQTVCNKSSYLLAKLTMRKLISLLPMTAIAISSLAQSSVDNSGGKKDSSAVVKEIADSLRMAHLFAIEQFPYVKGSKFSGAIPITGVTERPDPDQDYKLLFEVGIKNPDSLARNINMSLDEVARILNLHVASGISPKRIFPVIIVHGYALDVILNDQAYQKKYKINNPNLKLIKDLEGAGAKFIVCGQAMSFFDVAREEILPEIKISLTAQTVLSNYQNKGYVLYSIDPDK